jgi:hypothetical protein
MRARPRGSGEYQAWLTVSGGKVRGVALIAIEAPTFDM